MFLSFWFKRPQKQHIGNSRKDRIATGIVNKTIKFQERCATLLQNKMERLSVRGKVLMLIVFFLLSFGYSLYEIGENLIFHANKSLVIESIKISNNTGKAGDENIKVHEIISKTEYEKISRFKSYIDSLAKNPLGRRMHDSILTGRPGLLDSIVIIQELYKERN